jgi:hypothetical protein
MLSMIELAMMRWDKMEETKAKVITNSISKKLKLKVILTIIKVLKMLDEAFKLEQQNDGSEDSDSDEQSTEEFVLEDTLDRRTSTNAATQRNNAPPHSLHWAIRSRDAPRTTNLHRLAGSSNLVFIDQIMPLELKKHRQWAQHRVELF